MFVDASAIVAILKGEPEAEGFLAALDAARGKVYSSPIARYEAVISIAMSIARAKGLSRFDGPMREAAEELVRDLLTEAGAKDIHITTSIGDAARDAAERYGKLEGHPAKLNMGECFAYACAKAYRLQILYRGDDFAQTDLG